MQLSIKLVAQVHRTYFRSDWKAILLLFVTVLPLSAAMGLMSGIYHHTHQVVYLLGLGATLMATLLVILQYVRQGTKRFRKIQKEVGLVQPPGARWIRAGFYVALGLIALILANRSSQRALSIALVLLGWFVWSAIVAKIARNRPAPPEPEEEVERL